jgi:methionyl-tRNA formyltransferase
MPPGLAAGKFRVEMGRLFVGTAPGAIEIIEIQREGKRAMPVKEFLRGNMGLFNPQLST